MAFGHTQGVIACRGCFTGEFGLGPELPMEEAPFAIARDRLIEARHHRFDRKLLPIDEATQAPRSFERSSWIFSIWFGPDDSWQGRQLLWPNSPPFPALPWTTAGSTVPPGERPK